MKTDTRTVDDLLNEAEVEPVQSPKRRNDHPSVFDRQTLALSEALLDGKAVQRTLAYQPQNLGLPGTKEKE